MSEAYPDDKYFPSYLTLARHGLDGFQEAEAMRCEVCGAALTATKTDLPFKVREPGIVVFKGLPVLECTNCGGIELEIIR
jgi:YgiT-type zinc finger domain-containing protein